jgi:hypothetical protein
MPAATLPASRNIWTTVKRLRAIAPAHFWTSKAVSPKLLQRAPVQALGDCLFGPWQGTTQIDYRTADCRPASFEVTSCQSNLFRHEGIRVQSGSAFRLQPSSGINTKKADVAGHPKVFRHVGLLTDGPPRFA